MRDLACCTNAMAFYSTPSNLVRFALATNAISIFNLAHLVSVRALERARDRAARLALGAHPAYLVAKQVVEAVVLGSAGAVLAVASEPGCSFDLGLSWP